MDKTELKNQQEDWSGIIIDGASFDDLDMDAVKSARQKFVSKFKHRPMALKMINSFRDNEFLDKIGITVRGKVTNGAAALLGNPESAKFPTDVAPEIILNKSDKTAESFKMPLILAVENILKSIGCVDFGFINQTPPLPEGGNRYDADLLRILLFNCIAHQDYTADQKIEIFEYDDRLVITNNGDFLAESVEAAMDIDYRPDNYRNESLYKAMVEMGIIHSELKGIPRIFNIQEEKKRPAPVYDFSQPGKTSVTVFGKN